MEEPQAVTAPVVEGVAPESAPQETQATSTEAPAPQETTTPTVEGGVPVESSTAPERPKPSDFYEVRRLKREVREMKTLLERIGSNLNQQPRTSVAPEPELSVEQLAKGFLEEPEKHFGSALKELKKLQAELKDLRENGIQQALTHVQQTSERQRASQEAMEMLFPKEKPTDPDTPEDRGDLNPERTARIWKTIQDYKLQPLIESDPKGAAKLILKLSEIDAPARKGPPAPTKGQMASTATGTPRNEGVKKMTLDEIKREKDKLYAELDTHPEKRQDPAWQTRFQTLQNELTKLAQGSNA